MCRPWAGTPHTPGVKQTVWRAIGCQVAARGSSADIAMPKATARQKTRVSGMAATACRRAVGGTCACIAATLGRMPRKKQSAKLLDAPGKTHHGVTSHLPPSAFRRRTTRIFVALARSMMPQRMTWNVRPLRARPPPTLPNAVARRLPLIAMGGNKNRLRQACGAVATKMPATVLGASGTATAPRKCAGTGTSTAMTSALMA